MHGRMVHPQNLKCIARSSDTEGASICKQIIHCFRGIPDVWFDDFELVHFIRDVLLKHPAMFFWYPGKNSATHWWLSVPFK